MSDNVFIFLLGTIFCIVAVCPYLAWKITDEDDYYKKRKYIKAYLPLVCIYICACFLMIYDVA